MNSAPWAPPGGSSPLTRGKRNDELRSVGALGLIPAHAGKTYRSQCIHVVMRAHPRSRGENASLRDIRPLPMGSSPLTRGKPFARKQTRKRSGLIPAHAGKTLPSMRVHQVSRAHPRSRGENAVDAAASSSPRGSSPLTRGKHFLTCAFIAQIDQILESLELCASSESYSLMDAYATDAPQDQVRSTGLAPRSSRDAS